MITEWKTGTENVLKDTNYIEDPQALVCFLIEEVESVTHACQ
jgi:hypothetical protein